MKLQIPNHLKKIRTIKYTPEDLISFENEVKKHYENGEIKSPIHLSKGNEDQVIKIFSYIADIYYNLFDLYSYSTVYQYDIFAVSTPTQCSN